MKPLIAFWKAKLQHNLWLMSPEDKAMVKQTISALQELNKLQHTNRITRETEIIQTVKALENSKKGK